MKTAYCTYCSAQKSHDAGLLPAIHRYQSDRISSIHSAAQDLEISFVILSGEYGLLKPDDDVPYYDHCLKKREVPGLARRVAEQLTDMDIQTLIFFSRSDIVDPGTRPYRDCIEQACATAGVLVIQVEYKAGGRI